MARAIFSSALDEAHADAVERNPVEASMEDKAEDYVWSIATHHSGLVDSEVLMNCANNVIGVAEKKWSAWLVDAENKRVRDVLERI
jgi:hypothetical protein